MKLLEALNRPPRDVARTSSWVPAMRDTVGHLATTKNEVWAFYRLKPVNIDALNVHELDALIRDQAERWSELAGHDVWLRLTSIPFPCDAYHAEMQAPTGTLQTPPVGEAVSREELLESATSFPGESLGARLPVTVIGVRIATQALETCHLTRLVTDTPFHEAQQGLETVRETYRDVTASVGRAGWEAEPLSPEALTWLFDTGRALGHQGIPDDGLGDAHVRTVQDLDGVTVPVRVDVDGDVSTRHTRIMRLRSWRERDTAVLPAWLRWVSDQPYPIEVAARFTVVPPGKSVASAKAVVKKNSDILEHMADFKRPVTRAIRNAAERGPEIVDELESGVDALAVQVHGQVVFAVAGDTPREAVELAKTLKASAARGGGTDDARGPGLSLEAPPAQWAEWKKYIPCEPWDMAGHPQRQSCLMPATGVPNANHRAGDSRGLPCGNIAGSTDFYILDLFGGVRRDRPGVCAAIGDQGSGKSTFLSLSALWTVLIEGVPTVILDPSGKIKDQLAVPELLPYTREIRLDTNAKEGILASHFLTPDPLREAYETDEDYRAAVVAAETDRIETAIDWARAALPSTDMANQADVNECLRAAVTAFGGRYGAQPSQVVAAIEGEGVLGRRLAGMIRAYSKLSAGRMLWADRTSVDGGDYLLATSTAPLTIVSVAGVKTPQSPDRATWTTEEARSVALLAGVSAIKKSW